MPHQILGNLDLVKQINLATVFRCLDKHEFLSRIQLAEMTALAPASITKIIRQFLEIGLIKEVDVQASTGGRRAVSLALNREKFCSLAIRLGRKSITLGVYDLDSTLVAEQTLILAHQTQQQLEHLLMIEIKKFMASNLPQTSRLLAIAISLPGIITDVVRYMPHISVENWSLSDNIAATFNIPTYIEHDIRSLALAEHYFGKTRDVQDSIFIRIHHGVGAGIIMEGKLLLGRRQHLAEIGHIQINPNGLKCHCGNVGCLETVLSNQALVAHAKLALAEGMPSILSISDLSVAKIVDCALLNDPLALKLLKNAAYYLGQVIAQLVNLFNPEKIILAGELQRAQQILMPIVSQVVEQASLSNFNQNLIFDTSDFHAKSAIGSFAIVKKALYDGHLLMSLLETDHNSTL